MAYVLTLRRMTTYPREGERRRRRNSPAIRHQGNHLGSHPLHHLLLLGQLLLLLAHQSLHLLAPSPFLGHLILRCAIRSIMIVATENMKWSVDWGEKRTYPDLVHSYDPKPWAGLYSRLGARPALSELGETRNGHRVDGAVTNP